MRLWPNETVDYEDQILESEGFEGAIQDKRQALLSDMLFTGSLSDNFVNWKNGFVDPFDTGLPVAVALDFANGRFSLGDTSFKFPNLTINNASLGSRSYIDAAGDLAMAAAGVSRVADYSSGARAGLFEASATNLLLNSNTLSTQSVTVSAQEYTLHFEGTGTVTLSGAHSGTLAGAGTGYDNRVSLTFTPSDGTLTLTVSGTVTNAQMEAGAAGSSYIDTAGSTVARGADLAAVSLDPTKLVDGITVVVDFTAISQDAGGNFGRVIQLDDGSGDSRQQLMVYNADGVMGIELVSGGDAGVTSYNIPLGYGVRQRVAWTFKENYAQAAIGGVAGSLDTVAGYTPPTLLRLGNGVGPANWLNTHMHSVILYEGIASQAQLEAMTSWSVPAPGTTA